MERSYNLSGGLLEEIATYIGENLNPGLFKKIIGPMSAVDQPAVEVIYMAFLKQKHKRYELEDVFSLLLEKGFVTETMRSETQKYALGEFLENPENEKLDFNLSRYLSYFKILNIDNKKIRKAVQDLINRVYESAEYEKIVSFCKSAKIPSGKLSGEVKEKLRKEARKDMKNNRDYDLDSPIETLQFLGVSDSTIGILARHAGDDAILERGDADFAKHAYGKVHALGEELGKDRVRLLNHKEYKHVDKIGRQIKKSL